LTDVDAWNPLDSLPVTSDWDEIEGDLTEIERLDQDTEVIVSRYNLPQVTVSARKAFASHKGMEVGDDRVDTCRQPRTLARQLAVQSQIVGMVTSWEDTVISAMTWNFCEVTSYIPTTPFGSYNYCRKKGDFGTLDYTDSPVIRLIIDCSKQDNSHSSTNVGKSQLLGSRISTPRGENREGLMLASWYQDGCLRTSHSPDPKYLPAQMGGSSVRPLWDEPMNLYLYVHAYKGGKYQRLYGTATEELRDTLELIESGKASRPLLCSRLRQKQEYLHGTYDHVVFVPKAIAMDFNELPNPLWEECGGENLTQSYENRLIRTRHVITRRQAEIEMSKTRRLITTLFGPLSVAEIADQDRMVSHQRRARFEGALQANSAFANLLERKASPEDFYQLLGSTDFHPITSGARAFTKEHAHWLAGGGRSNTLTIDDITFGEDIFLRSEVSSEESLKVGGLHLRPWIFGRQKSTITTTRVGLYQINRRMYDWAEDLTNRISNRRVDGLPVPLAVLQEECLRDPEWVNDDTGIIASCLRDTAKRMGTQTSVYLVSTDRRLANQLSQTCNVTTILVSPEIMIKGIPRETWSSTSRVSVDELEGILIPYKTVPRPVLVYIDTGSLAAHASKWEYEPKKPKQIAKVSLLQTGRGPEGRFDRVRKEYFSTRELVHVDRRQVFYPVSRPKLKRSIMGGPESAYSSRSSWYRTASGSHE